MPYSGSGRKTFQPHLQWPHSLGWSCQYCRTQKEDLQGNRVPAYSFAIKFFSLVNFISLGKISFYFNVNSSHTDGLTVAKYHQWFSKCKNEALPSHTSRWGRKPLSLIAATAAGAGEKTSDTEMSNPSLWSFATNVVLASWLSLVQKRSFRSDAFSL